MVHRDTYAKGLIPIGEAARRLGVSIDTLRRWGRDGRIAEQRTLGGQRRYRPEDVEALLPNQRAAS